MSVAPTRMLRWMCGTAAVQDNQKRKPSRNGRVVPIEDKVREDRLRWF